MFCIKDRFLVAASAIGTPTETFERHHLVGAFGLYERHIGEIRGNKESSQGPESCTNHIRLGQGCCNLSAQQTLS